MMTYGNTRRGCFLALPHDRPLSTPIIQAVASELIILIIITIIIDISSLSQFQKNQWSLLHWVELLISPPERSYNRGNFFVNCSNFAGLLIKSTSSKYNDCSSTISPADLAT
eukprot:Tbor_TRINITY_DN4805_c0_g2::TRINITY_DN4805_c0_g2_i1::g.1430::m.1430